MRRTILFAALFMLALCATPAALADGNVNFTLGARHMSDDGWRDLNDQPAAMVQVDFGPENWPIRLAAAFGGSADDDNQTLEDIFDFQPNRKATVNEVAFGVLWLPNRKTLVRPYVGAGLVKTWQKFEFTDDDVSDSDNSLGVYVNAGIYWRLGTRFNLGIDGRLVRGTDGTLFDRPGSADYSQIGVLLGWGW